MTLNYSVWYRKIHNDLIDEEGGRENSELSS